MNESAVFPEDPQAAGFADEDLDGFISSSSPHLYVLFHPQLQGLLFASSLLPAAASGVDDGLGGIVHTMEDLAVIFAGCSLDHDAEIYNVNPFMVYPWAAKIRQVVQ